MSERQSPDTLEKRLVSRAIRDPEFRRLLKSEPKAAVEQVTGRQVPPGVGIRVVEEGEREIVIVLPHIPERIGSRALSDQELDEVTGGHDNWLDTLSNLEGWHLLDLPGDDAGTVSGL
jgi:hypothetical protein